MAKATDKTGPKARNNIMKRGESWYVRVHLEGRDVWRSAGRSRENAQLMLAHLREDAERGEVGLAKKHVPTLRDFVDTFLKWAKVHKRSADRDARSLRFLVARLGHFKLSDLTKPRLEAYQNDRLTDAISGGAKRSEAAEPRRVQNATVNREVACLRKLLSRAVEVGEIRKNPLLGIRMLPEAPARQPALSADEERRLMAACTPPWVRVLVRVAIGTGMRQGEVLALKWGDLDTEAGEAIVRDSKSGRSRRVPVHPAVLAELQELRKARERAADATGGEGGEVRDLKRRREIPDSPIVLTDANESPTPNAVVQAFARARRRIGRDDLHFHDLRHVYASRLLGAGASLPEVADTLGHRTLHMAKRYAHTNPARLRSLVAEIELADNGAAKPAGDAVKGEGKE